MMQSTLVRGASDAVGIPHSDLTCWTETLAQQRVYKAVGLKGPTA